MQLYKIATEYEKAFNAMTADAELAPDVLTPEVIEDSLAAIKDDFDNKAINVSYVAKNLEAEAKAIKDAEKMMAERRKNLEKQIQRIEDYLLHNMERCGITEIKCPYFVIKVKNCPPSVKILSEEFIPDEFMRTKTTKEPDKAKLKDHLKDHTVTFAVLERKKRLEIK